MTKPTPAPDEPGEGFGAPGQTPAGRPVGATNGHAVSFGVGDSAGVLPGDQRTFDDVEAGIVALWRAFGKRREQPLRDRLVLHYAPLVKYVAGRVGTGLPAHVEVADLIQSGIFGLLDAIEKDRQPLGSMYDGRAALEMIHAVYASQRAGKPVDLPLKERGHPLAGW